MFMRILQLRLNPEYTREFKKFYEETVSPQLQKVDGCLFASLIKGKPHNDEYISLTFWKTKQQAESYENGIVFKSMIEQSKPFFSENSDEWKIQLTENMEIQYSTSPDEPSIKKYSTLVQKSGDESLARQSERMFLRIVSLKIEEDKMDEFEKLYSDVVIPSFQKAKGCMNAFLNKSVSQDNDFISISIWDNSNSANDYELSKEYKEMIDKVKHTFSQIYLWGMSLEKEYGSTVKTTDDMNVGHYDVVTGKSFI